MLKTKSWKSLQDIVPSELCQINIGIGEYLLTASDVILKHWCRQNKLSPDLNIPSEGVSEGSCGCG